MPRLQTLSHHHDIGTPAAASIEQAFNRHQHCVLAVSGGSDSMALMALAADFVRAPENQTDQESSTFHVVTVNHGLRPEAAAEAEFTAREATRLGFSHQTITLKNVGAKSETLRNARYIALTDYARTVSATAIFLAHTLDDQAETVLMRAKRATPMSATRGLSGMPDRASHGCIALERPLLGVGRNVLRAWLKNRSIPWIDDPTNKDETYERVRTRKLLAHGNKCLPSKNNLAKLASLTSRSRAWLNRQTADYLLAHASFQSDRLILNHGTSTPPNTLLMDVYAYCVLVVGGQARRVARAKLENAVYAHLNRDEVTCTAGDTIITVSTTKVEFRREWRNRSGPPNHFDLRENPWPGLTRFRPACDDVIHQTFRVLVERSRSIPSL